MIVDTNNLVPMIEANQNFSNEIKIVKEVRENKISDTADLIIKENIEAFKELAK